MKNLRFKTNDTWELVITISVNSVAVDLRLYSFKLTVKEFDSDTSAVLTQTHLVANGVSAVYTTTLTVANTSTNITPNTYLYEIEITKPDATVVTSETGLLTVEKDLG